MFDLLQKKIYLLLLSPLVSALRSFEARLRTRSVDVDSRGRACKERMMRVVCSDIQIHELQLEDLEGFEVSAERTMTIKDFVKEKLPPTLAEALMPFL